MSHVVGIEEAERLEGDLRQQAYCALDCTGTLEIFNRLHGRLTPAQARIYAFERALQAPALAMQMRGVRVDTFARAKAVADLKKDLRRMVRDLDLHSIVREHWDGKEKDTGACSAPTRKDGKHKWPKGIPDDDPDKRCADCCAPRLKRKPFNANSPLQCDRLFYALLEAPPQRNKAGKRSTDEECIRRIGKQRADLRPLTDAILEIRGVEKQLGFLEARLSPDNRFHSSFNVGGTWTGRWSSSKSPLGGGGNAQNISERHRHIFVADHDHELCYVDLERAESWVVAMLSGDQNYIEAHFGDTHTYVARMVWPDLPWTGDLAEDKKIASSLNPPWDSAPGHNYRFFAKKMQHGSNYGLTPYGIMMIEKIPLREAEKAQETYFDAFPGILMWHDHERRAVEASEELVNPFGRGIRLFGRPWDPATFRKALAYKPQSTVADVLNLSLWRIWNQHDPHLIQLLAQVHDAILCQWPENRRAWAVKALREAMEIPFPVADIHGITRTLCIPIEIAVGKNWGKRKPETNPQGIEELKDAA